MKAGWRPGRRGRGPSERLALAALLAALLVGSLVVGWVVLGLLDVASSDDREPAPAARQMRPLTRGAGVAAPVAAEPIPAATRGAGRARRPVRAPRPVRISIPAMGVSAPVIPLGLDRTGALEVPQDFSDTGWWTGGSRPGERGPAVIVGHVDSHTGPAVFFRVSHLHRGDAITVERADGSRVRFHVQRSARYPKSRFPTAEVYGPTAAPTLRLITCSGTFDRASGHYLDNTVVYAGR